MKGKRNANVIFFSAYNKLSKNMLSTYNTVKSPKD